MQQKELTMGVYSKELSDKILEIMPKLNKEGSKERVLSALQCLGPSCFFQDCETEEEAKGAIRLLNWIEEHLDYEPTEDQIREVREGVDQLIAQGKVYRDPEGRIWPKGHTLADWAKIIVKE
jgi:hypothetical protein